MSDATLRLACSGGDCRATSTGRVDWPLLANRTYYNAGTIASQGIFSTDALALISTMINALPVGGGEGQNPRVITRINSVWAYEGNNCFANPTDVNAKWGNFQETTFIPSGAPHFVYGSSPTLSCTDAAVNTPNSATLYCVTTN